MAHQEAGVHEHHTADDEYVAVPGSSYEHTDANVWAIVKFGIWLAAMALIVHVGIGLMYSMWVEQAKAAAEQPYPLAAGTEPKLPLEPRLQQFPANEIYYYRLELQEKAQGYGWADREAGRVRIPIAEAMRLTLERGLPARADDPAHPAATPGLLASDGSAGRVMERRRQ